MTKSRRKFFLTASKFFDLLIMTVSFFMAAGAALFYIEGISFNEFLAMRFKIQNIALFCAFLLLWHIVFSLLGLYRSRRFSHWLTETFDVIKATSFGTFVIFITAHLLEIQMVTPIFLVLFWGITSTITIVSRLLMRYLLKQVRLRGRNIRFMVVVGTNQRAINFAKLIESKEELGYRIIGFVDESWHGIGEINKTFYQLVANLRDFPSFLRSHVVDEVVMALPVASYYQEASRIAALCEEQGIMVRYLSDIFNHKISRTAHEYLGGELLTSHNPGMIHGERVLIKRVLDVALCSVLLLLLSPLFLVSALLIMITSPGPVFFIQERVGLNKRKFRLYKFRTMVDGAEQKLSELEDLNEVSGPVFKITNDPRITWIGKFLRKSSIDELPQLINILKGDMSLVGPRPLPMRDFNGFDTDWHRRRFSVRPGITCLWQVNGRSDIPFEKWMQLDMEYIDTWSLWLDLKILGKTIPAVLKVSGAS